MPFFKSLQDLLRLPGGLVDLTGGGDSPQTPEQARGKATLDEEGNPPPFLLNRKSGEVAFFDPNSKLYVRPGFNLDSKEITHNQALPQPLRNAHIISKLIGVERGPFSFTEEKGLHVGPDAGNRAALAWERVPSKPSIGKKDPSEFLGDIPVYTDHNDLQSRVSFEAEVAQKYKDVFKEDIDDIGLTTLLLAAGHAPAENKFAGPALVEADSVAEARGVWGMYSPSDEGVQKIMATGEKAKAAEESKGALKQWAEALPNPIPDWERLGGAIWTKDGILGGISPITPRTGFLRPDTWGKTGPVDVNVPAVAEGVITVKGPFDTPLPVGYDPTVPLTHYAKDAWVILDEMANPFRTMDAGLGTAVLGAAVIADELGLGEGLKNIYVDPETGDVSQTALELSGFPLSLAIPGVGLGPKGVGNVLKWSARAGRRGAAVFSPAIRSSLRAEELAGSARFKDVFKMTPNPAGATGAAAQRSSFAIDLKALEAVNKRADDVRKTLTEAQRAKFDQRLNMVNYIAKSVRAGYLNNEFPSTNRILDVVNGRLQEMDEIDTAIRELEPVVLELRREGQAARARTGALPFAEETAVDASVLRREEAVEFAYETVGRPTVLAKYARDAYNRITSLGNKVYKETKATAKKLAEAQAKLAKARQQLKLGNRKWTPDIIERQAQAVKDLKAKLRELKRADTTYVGRKGDMIANELNTHNLQVVSRTSRGDADFREPIKILSISDDGLSARARVGRSEVTLRAKTPYGFELEVGARRLTERKLAPDLVLTGPAEVTEQIDDIARQVKELNDELSALTREQKALDAELAVLPVGMESKPRRIAIEERLKDVRQRIGSSRATEPGTLYHELDQQEVLLQELKRAQEAHKRANLFEAEAQVEDRFNALLDRRKEIVEELIAITNPSRAKVKMDTLKETVDLGGGATVTHTRKVASRIAVEDITDDSVLRRAVNDMQKGMEAFLARQPKPGASREQVAQYALDKRAIISEGVGLEGLMDEASNPKVVEIVERALPRLDQRNSILMTMAKIDLDTIQRHMAPPTAFSGNRIVRWLQHGTQFIRGSANWLSGNTMSPWGRSILAASDSHRSAIAYEMMVAADGVFLKMDDFAKAMKVHGGSPAERMRNLLRSGFKKDDFDVILRQRNYEKLPRDEQGAIIVSEALADEVGSNLFMYLQEPGWWSFPDKKTATLMKGARGALVHAYDQLNAAMRLEGMSPQKEGILLNMLHPSVRKQIGVFTRGGEADALEMLVNTESYLRDQGPIRRILFGITKTHAEKVKGLNLPGITPLARVVRSGPDMMTGILGNMQRRIINKQLFTNIFDGYASERVKKGGKISDLFTFEGGGVHFRHPDNIKDAGLPAGISRRQVQSDLKHLTKLMSGEVGAGPLRVPAQIARQIGISRLISDLSILGVQAPMYFALNPLKVPDFVHHALSVTKDVNYLHWVTGNMDEISLYMRHGLRVGIESYLGGEFQPTWWVEHLPLFGGIGKGISTMNDIQFTRWMLYMKTEAVRNHMSTWNMINKSRRHLGAFVTDPDGPPGLKLVNEELGGRYLTSTKTDVLDAVIRVVNNQLGGLARHQTGVGAVRQAADQIMLIVPGFARARAGLIVTALNKPHTIEGMLSASVLAREILYAGSLSYMASHLLGAADQWNGVDPRKFDWLAAKLPGGQTITLLPSPSILRGFMRLAGGYDNIGSVSERASAIQTMLRGRLSPLAGAVVNLWRNEDFLGRKYSSNFDALLDNVQIFTPIFAEQAIGALTEDGTPLKEMLSQQLPVELLGRSYVPDFASDKLDRIVQNDHPQISNGRKWFELTSEDKTLIRLVDDRLGPLEEQLERELSAKETDMETAQRQVFDNMENLSDFIYNTPQNINGVSSTQAQDDLLLANQEVTGTEWVERNKARQAQERGMMDAYETTLISAFGGKPLDEIRTETTERRKEHLSPVVLCLREIKALSPDDFRDTKFIALRDGRLIPVEVTDWDAYNEAKDEIYALYPDEVAAQAESVLALKKTPTQRAYNTAQKEFTAYTEIPKYIGYTLDQGDQIDRFRRVFRDTVTSVRSMGDGEITAEQIRVRLLRMMAQGKMLDANMLNLALAAHELEGPKSAVLENPLRPAYIIQHPMMVTFFDFLASEVPATFKQLLPQGVSPSIDLRDLQEGVNF